MELKISDLQKLAEAELNTYSLKKFDFDRLASLNFFKKDLQEEFKDLNLKDTKRKRLEYFKVKGATTEDYEEKIFFLDKSRFLIGGIRNFGGDPKIPFVQIKSSFSLTSKEQVLDLYDSIKSHFQVFNPLFLSFFTAKKIVTDRFGQITMLSRSDEIKRRGEWEGESILKLRKIQEPNDYYDWYEKGYEQFHEERPDLKPSVVKNSLEIMEISRSDDLLCFVEIEGKKIGLVAAEKRNFLGQKGIYFNDIFISKEWKGKGLAKKIQRKFIQEFTEGDEWIWGTIDSKNTPSLKTALANGREAVRYECFVNLV